MCDLQVSGNVISITADENMKKSYNEPSMTTMSNSYFKPSVQAQSVSALEMAPVVQQLMGK